MIVILGSSLILILLMHDTDQNINANSYVWSQFSKKVVHTQPRPALHTPLRDCKVCLVQNSCSLCKQIVSFSCPRNFSDSFKKTVCKAFQWKHISSKLTQNFLFSVPPVHQLLQDVSKSTCLLHTWRVTICLVHVIRLSRCTATLCIVLCKELEYFARW